MIEEIPFSAGACIYSKRISAQPMSASFFGLWPRNEIPQGSGSEEPIFGSIYKYQSRVGQLEMPPIGCLSWGAPLIQYRELQCSGRVIRWQIIFVRPSLTSAEVTLLRDLRGPGHKLTFPGFDVQSIATYVLPRDHERPYASDENIRFFQHDSGRVRCSSRVE